MATNASPGADARAERAIVGTDSKTRQQRFHRLAEVMALVMQHPQTNDSCQTALKSVSQIVLKYADLSPLFFDKPRPNSETRNAIKLFTEFGFAFADAIDDDDLPSGDFDSLSECSNEIEYLLRPENQIEAEAGRIRGMVKEYARIWATPFPPLPEEEQILRRFAKATCQLLAHPDTPEKLCDAISTALNALGNELFLFDYAPEVEARQVLHHFFTTPEAAPALPKRKPAPVATKPTGDDVTDLAESLAANLQDDGLLETLIRLVHRIADEPDRLKREGMALAVSAQAYLRTNAFTNGISGILRGATS